MRSRDMVLDKPHVSASQIALLEDCTLAWYFRYVKKIRTLSTIQMLTGIAYHEALAYNFRQKLETGINLPLEDVLAEFDSVYDSAFDKGSVALFPGQSKKKFREQGKATLSNYYTDYACSLHPHLVEHGMVRDIPGTDFCFIGDLDLETVYGNTIDFKLAGTKWAKKKANDIRQASAYAFLMGKQWLDFEFHIGARDTGSIQIMPVAHEEFDVGSFIETVRHRLDLMEGLRCGEILPKPKTGYCNEQLCGFYQECQAFKYGL